MEQLNPRSLEELREEEEMRRFLEGEETSPTEPHNMQDQPSRKRHGH